MSKLTTASVLAFERRLDISDAIFFQKSASSDKLSPVKITEKAVRGTISNRLKNAIANDPTKLDAEIQKPNLQTVDVAALDYNKDILVVRWSCKVLPFEGKPNVCNNPKYQEALEATVQDYLKNVGIRTLASRYAYNIINARWLWRNRMSAEKIDIKVTIDDKTLEFPNVKSLSFNSFDYQNEQLTQLIDYIEKGFKGEQYVFIQVQAEVKMGEGQEVYPSEELVLDNSTSNRKSKILYQVSNIAGMHSQKIGNSIRTIDTWYTENATFPIAIEPYGAVTNLGTAFRQPKQKMDFYTLFDNWVLKDDKPKLEQQHYVIAVLIRGGVFGASGKE
ncbi:CRISPR-associated protein Cas5 [Gallibacterium salpingitidis]|uniref:CRISPR-associated protein Cas5 n=1 Tax=Gallibacterium salpingitidis TaxID=505341 RepID=A0AB36E019_9PAST|nr:type I-F CRISPR-associated protein Csy3 [Gallibacterium salpingitidis]OBX07445.1 CRISPR-associated protein Cas5 [Gallibacterium salpingitidis]OBX09613.1 CRISPR-associated protein Cas5 [Gallibacterium salpingitidis]WKT00852.1 type I-F CRISPR-associated protein Csy3 [Gallibacterium salpingitidis]